MFDPRIDRHLIADQGEVVVDEVRKHWAATVAAVLELFGGTVVFLLTFFVPPQAWWVPALAGGAVVLHASWRILEQRMDRFVITNMRVFRVHGILSQRIATMPLSRILDISVHKPVVGRMFGFGHFVFESAAQEQGLREIRFVGDPDERGLTIQRVIQQAGLRGYAGRGDPSHPAPPPAPVLPPPPRVPASVAAAASYDTLPVAVERHDENPAGTMGWDWLADAQRREVERLAELRGDPPQGQQEPAGPDGTDTAPIDLPR
ncbi:PH domain-containing protein [Microbacterium cremeum]|uniref:PH domain-containing protein n=1 Tax=Microbacterium cremeum TaxID=2782169 RepID=UPI0018889EAE|nr:PH domain-containing protein [Microbacterium cremeum]